MKEEGEMGKPVWLLDIDGVINSISVKEPKHIWPSTSWERGEVQNSLSPEKWPMLWSRDVVDFILTIHADDLAEIRWHTTWQEEAVLVSELVGLPEFPIAKCPEFRENGSVVAAEQMREGRPGWWKYMTAERVLVEEKRPLIWTDDDITWEMTRIHRAQLALKGEVLFICPDQATGLTPKHLEKIGQKLEVWNG
jgi:hypothetical protein